MSDPSESMCAALKASSTLRGHLLDMTCTDSNTCHSLGINDISRETVGGSGLVKMKGCTSDDDSGQILKNKDNDGLSVLAGGLANQVPRFSALPLSD